MVRLTFSPIFESWFLVAVIIVAITLLVFLMPLRTNRVSARHRLVILLLRIGCVLLLLFAMVRPAVVYRETTPLPATLVILIDQSESMSIADEVGGRSRYDIACDVVNSAAETINALSKQHEISPYLFDRQLQPLTWERKGTIFPEKPLGNETAIGFSLQQVLEQTAGKRLLGTILLTDGTQRTRPPYDLLPQETAAYFRDNGNAIYAIRLGRSSTPDIVQDVAVQDLLVNDRVFVKNELLVSGQLRVQGFAGRRVPVSLFFETSPGQIAEVARQEYEIRESTETVPFQFRYEPQTPGLCKLTVSVPPQPRELLETNNSLSSFVRVLDGGLKVLYIEGTWRHESKSLRESLNASPDIQFDYIRVPTGVQGLLLEKLQPGEYMAFVLGDIDSTAFEPAELQALADRVREGAGLIMLGGFQSFGAGGYFNTPLADVSPIAMTALDRQQPGASIREDLHISGDVTLHPAPLFRQHYLLRLSTDLTTNDKLWRTLPAFLGANRLRAKPTAQVLARSGDSPDSPPLLTMQNYGSGRVLAFAVDSTWRWCLRGYSEEHKRFWRQTVLWLAKYDDLLEGDCWVELDKTRFLPGDVVSFRVRAKAKTGEEILSPRATVTVETPEGTTLEVALVDENGVMTGSFRATQIPGDYRVTASVQTDISTPGQPGEPENGSIKSASARFLVIDRNVELDNPIASPMVLENITVMTGGRTIAPEQFPQLLEELTRQSSELVEQRETKKTLYDTWPFLLLFVACISAEWFLRKRWGAV